MAKAHALTEKDFLGTHEQKLYQEAIKLSEKLSAGSEAGELYPRVRGLAIELETYLQN